MPASVHMKNGDWFKINAWRDDVEKAMIEAHNGGVPYKTYERLEAGVPLPKVTIDVREIAYVNETRL